MAEGNTVFDWTFDAAFSTPNYQIDGDGAARVIDEEATAERLTLTARVTTANLTSVWRPLKSDQGEVEILDIDDGGFSAIDRANGSNTFTLDPPAARKPLRQSGEYHVDSYEEELVSQDLGEFNVEVEFVRDANRTDEPSSNEVKSGASFPWTFDQAFTKHGGWGFDTRYGQIVTERVDAELLGTGADGVRRFEITARLTFNQAHVFEAALSRLGGTRVRDIPDGTNLLVDDTGGDATLTVDVPDGQDIISDGEFVVTDWTSTRINDAFQTVSWEMGPSA